MDDWTRKFYRIDQLKDPDPLVRREIAQMLYNNVANGSDIYAKEFVEALEDPDPRVRMLMADIFAERARNREDIKEALPALAKALGDEKAFVRKSASEAIVIATGNASLGFEPVVDALIKALKDDDKTVKKNAAEAFCSYRYCPDKHIAVIGALNRARHDEEIRYFSIWALSNISETCRHVLIDSEIFLEHVFDKDETVAVGAMEAVARAYIGSIDFERTQMVMGEAVKRNPGVGLGAAMAYARLCNNLGKDVDLEKVKEWMTQAVRKKPGLRRAAAKAYARVCEKLREQRQKIDMPGEVLKARPKPPKRTFRMGRAYA